jgi:hypothetical protein
VGWELCGFDRCSVLVITGIFKFLLPQKNVFYFKYPKNILLINEKYYAVGIIKIKYLRVQKIGKINNKI